MTRYSSCLDTPLGPLGIISSSTHILGITFSAIMKAGLPEELPRVHRNCQAQLMKYFSGGLKYFDLPLKPVGTEFQQKVWQALLKIPHGQTLTYRQLTDSLGEPKAIRAVAAANGKNKIPIIIPCHRVVGSDGSLVGFAGGLRNKEWLLRHEGALSQYSLFNSN